MTCLGVSKKICTDERHLYVGCFGFISPRILAVFPTAAIEVWAWTVGREVFKEKPQQVSDELLFREVAVSQTGNVKRCKRHAKRR